MTMFEDDLFDHPDPKSFKSYEEMENSLAHQEHKAKVNSLLEKHDLEKTETIRIQKTVEFQQQFIVVFTENLYTLVKMGLSKNEMIVVAYILNKVEYGNLISLKQVAVCKATGLNKSVVSKVWKKLYELGVLLKDDEDNEYLNSNIFAKGMSSKLSKERLKNLKKSRKETPDFPNAYTDRRRKSNGK